jgi:thiol-disulfide isomerase/thioredoxin
MKTIFFLLAILTFQFTYATDSDTLVDKKTMTSVKVKNMEGEIVDILDYANNGKITIISFWATWCKPCIKELKNIDALYEEWQDEYDVELVAVSVDDSRNSNKVKTMVNGLGWEYDVLLDPNGELQRDLNVTNPPVTLLLNEKGEIVYIHTGYLEGDEYKLEEQIKKLVN